MPHPAIPPHGYIVGLHPLELDSGVWCASSRTQVTRLRDATCAAQANGRVKCWGDNAQRNLGRGSTTADSQTPSLVLDPNEGSGFLEDVVEVASTWYSVCALKSNGTVWCWGNSGYGGLGQGNNPGDQGNPVQVHGVDDVELLTGVDTIGNGRYHYCATQGNSPSRTVVCWGYNGGGQLGDGTLTQRWAPVEVSTDTGFSGGPRSISGGVFNTCVLKENGEAWCWGYDAFGKNGDENSGGYDYTPTQVTGDFDDWIAINNHTDDASSVCAVRAHGDTYCWGNANNGERGNGTTGTASSPTLVHMSDASVDLGNPDFLSPATELIGGYNSQGAIHADGSVSTWGYNNAGQLGTGHSTQRTEPHRIGMPVR